MVLSDRNKSRRDPIEALTPADRRPCGDLPRWASVTGHATFEADDPADLGPGPLDARLIARWEVRSPVGDLEPRLDPKVRRVAEVSLYGPRRRGARRG